MVSFCCFCLTSHNLIFRFTKKQLASLISFFQIDIANEDVNCTCNLYQFRTFLLKEGKKLIASAKHLHTRPYNDTNFQTWHCKAHPMLGGKTHNFINAEEHLFICNTGSGCHKNCSCYTRPVDNSLLIDCYGKGLTEFPANLPLPQQGAQFHVYLDNNTIKQLPDCNDEAYNWLRYVTTLQLYHNSIATNSPIDLEHFLYCAKLLTYLSIADNNIKYIPKAITSLKFSNLDISNNPILCCNSPWIKKWLQNDYSHINYIRRIVCSDIQTDGKYMFNYY